MKVSFDLEKKDLYLFQKHVFRKFYWPVYLIIFVLFSGMVINLFSSKPNWTTIVINLGLIFFIVSFTRMWPIKWMAKEPVEHVVMEISPDGIRYQTEKSDSFLKWDGIKSVEKNKEYIYLIKKTHQKRLVMAYVVPKRCFSSESEADLFYRECVKYHQSNGAKKHDKAV